MYKDIEFVDERNSVSLIAEAVAKKLLRNRGILPEMDVSSSGILVTLMKTANDYRLIKLIGPYISVFLDKELITPRESRELRLSLEEGLEKRRYKLREDRTALKQLEDSVEQIKSLLYNKGAWERGNVEKILKERLRNPPINKRIFDPKPTKARKNAGLIFPMSKKVYTRVQKIYSGSPHNPKIELLTDRFEGEIWDPFLATKDEFVRSANQTEEATKKVIKEYFGNN